MSPINLPDHTDLTGDATAEARVLWAQWQLTLDMLPRGAVPGYSWGENPVARLLDMRRFLLETPGERWRHLACA